MVRITSQPMDWLIASGRESPAAWSHMEFLGRIVFVARATKYPRKLCERAVRVVNDGRSDYPSQY
ncbi:hypothetical protein GCM10009573_24380 [Agromyces bracchium]